MRRYFCLFFIEEEAQNFRDIACEGIVDRFFKIEQKLGEEWTQLLSLDSLYFSLLLLDNLFQ
jgi:hypothetical protein